MQATTKDDLTLIEHQALGEHIHLLILNRPERKNALNTALLRQLARHCEALVENGARAILIQGKDGHFAAGADIDEIATLTPKQALLDARVTAWKRLREIPVPLIAIAEGYCLGGGMELLLTCDFAIAHPDAQFGLPEVKLGLMPGAGGTQILPRTVGTRRAARMIFTGDLFDAKTMHDWGIITDLSDTPAEKALAIAERIAKNAPFAIRQAKTSLKQSQESGLETALKLERQAFSLLAATADRDEGIAAFRQKRAPQYQGE
ncbi:MAG: enoyl-CoA hydratase-related protein [Cardiobacteriaceae bacterium]|nr:enoyl-CoA hydratase-related protein [Cardiobacteriaceae bacterium]